MDSSQMNGNQEEPVNISETPHTPVLESVSRLSKIPMVEKTLTAATDVYEKVKESSSALNWTLTTAESTVNKAVETAMPLTAKLERPLKRVDSLICSSLDYVESKVPAVKLPPQEILDTTKTLVAEKATAVKEYSAAVKEYSGQKLRSMSLDRQTAALLAQNCKDLASTSMEKAKNAAHRLMAPKEELELEEEEESKKEKQPPSNSQPGSAEAIPPAAMQYEGGDSKNPPYVMRY